MFERYSNEPATLGCLVPRNRLFIDDFFPPGSKPLSFLQLPCRVGHLRTCDKISHIAIFTFAFGRVLAAFAEFCPGNR